MVAFAGSSMANTIELETENLDKTQILKEPSCKNTFGAALSNAADNGLSAEKSWEYASFIYDLCTAGSSWARPM